MKKLVLSIAAVVMTVLGLGGVATISPAYAAPGDQYINDITPSGAKTDLKATLNVVINVVLGVVGMAAVIMMIIGGIGFVTSQGDAAKVTKARNTILYGVIGLVIALLAFAIVNFVLSNVFTS